MQVIRLGVLMMVAFCANFVAGAPTGFVKTTIPLNAPPVGLAFDSNGVLWALEAAPPGSNVATLRSIWPNGTFGDSFPIKSTTGDNDEIENDNFFVGSMTYDHVGARLLLSDNTVDGRLYSIDSGGVQQTLVTGIAGLAGVAVRETGEIFVSTSPFGSEGEVRLVYPATNSSTPVLGGLGFGAGLAFDANNDLVVQDADSTTFLGRLQRLPISEGPSGLEFGMPTPVVIGTVSSAGVTVDSEGDIFTTGNGGLYRVGGTPPTELPFDNNGNPSQFATAIAFDPGSLPFEGFRGPGGGRLTYMADFGFASQDSFITLLTPAQLGDYDANGDVDDADYALWLETYGATDAVPADGNLDGITSAADYVAWRKFAPSMNDLLHATPQASVPESATTSIIALPLLSAASFWQRRRRRSAARFGPKPARRKA